MCFDDVTFCCSTVLSAVGTL